MSLAGALSRSRERTSDGWPVEWDLTHPNLSLQFLNDKYTSMQGDIDKMEPSKTRVNTQNSKGNAPHSEVYAEFKKWWPTVPEGKLFYMEMVCPKLGGLKTTTFHVKSTEMMKVGNDADQGDIERKIRTEWRDYNDNKRFDKFAVLIENGRRQAKREAAAEKLRMGIEQEARQRKGPDTTTSSEEATDSEYAESSDTEFASSSSGSADRTSRGSFTTLNSDGDSDLTVTSGEYSDEDEEEEGEWTECSTNSDDELFGTDTSDEETSTSDEETSEGSDDEINVPREVLGGKRAGKKRAAVVQAKKGGGGAARRGRKNRKNIRRQNKRGGARGGSSRKKGVDPWQPPQCIGYNYDTFWELNFADFEPEKAETGADSFLKRIIRSLILREHTTASSSRCITRLALTEYFEILDRAGVLQSNNVTPETHPELWTEMIENNSREVRDVCDKSPVLEIRNFGWFDVTTYVEQVWFTPTLILKNCPNCDSLTRYLTSSKMWSLAGTKAIHRTFGAFRLSLGEWIPTINGEEDFSVVLDEKKLNSLSKRSCTPLLANIMMASAQLVDEAWEYMENTLSNTRLCFERLDPDSTQQLPSSLALEVVWLSDFQKNFGTDKFHTLFMMADQLYKCLNYITTSKIQGSALFPAHRIKHWITEILNQLFTVYPHLTADRRMPRGYPLDKSGKEQQPAPKRGVAGGSQMVEEIRAEDIQLYEALLRDESVPVGGAAAGAGSPGGTIGRGEKNSLYKDIPNARAAGGVNWLKHKEGLTIPWSTPLQGDIQTFCDYWANFGLNWVTFELSWLRPDHKDYEVPSSKTHHVESTFDPTGAYLPKKAGSTTPIYLNSEKLSGFLHRIALFMKGFLLGLMEKPGGYTIQLKYLKLLLSTDPVDLGWQPPAWFEEDITALKVYAFGLRATCPKKSALHRELEALTTLEQVAMVSAGIDSQGLSGSQLTRGKTRPFASYKTGSWDSEEKLRTLMSVELERCLQGALNCEDGEYIELLEGRQGPNSPSASGADAVDEAATAAARACSKPRKRLSEIRVGEYHAGEILQRGREFQRASVELVGTQSLGAWTMNSVRTASYLQKVYGSAKGGFELFLGNHMVALWELSRVRVTRVSQQMQLILCLLQMGQGRTAREWWKRVAPICSLTGPDLDLFEKRIPEFCAKYEAKTAQTIDMMVHPSWDRLLAELSPAEAASHQLMTVLQETEKTRSDITRQVHDEKKEIESAEKEIKTRTANITTLEKSLQSEKSKQKKALEKLKKGKGSEVDSIQQSIVEERKALEHHAGKQRKKKATLTKAKSQVEATLASLEAELGELLEEGGEELLTLYQEQLDQEEDGEVEADEVEEADAAATSDEEPEPQLVVEVSAKKSTKKGGATGASAQGNGKTQQQQDSKKSGKQHDTAKSHKGNNSKTAGGNKSGGKKKGK